MKNVSNSICGIIESFQYYPEKIEDIVTPPICKQLLSYLDPNVASGLILKPRIIKAISAVVKVSPKISNTAINDHLGSHLYQVLTKHAPLFDDDESNDTVITEKNTTAIIQSLIYTDKDILLSSLGVFSNVFPNVEAGKL